MMAGAGVFIWKGLAGEELNLEVLLAGIGLLFLAPQQLVRPVLWSKPIGATMAQMAEAGEVHRFVRAASLIALACFIASFGVRYL